MDLLPARHGLICRLGRSRGVVPSAVPATVQSERCRPSGADICQPACFSNPLRHGLIRLSHLLQWTGDSVFSPAGTLRRSSIASPSRLPSPDANVLLISYVGHASCEPLVSTAGARSFDHGSRHDSCPEAPGGSV